MADTDLLCSMTAEPEPTREHLAERLSVLERELARAKQTILHLECERDELKSDNTENRDRVLEALQRAEKTLTITRDEWDAALRMHTKLKHANEALGNMARADREARDELAAELETVIQERDTLKIERDEAMEARARKMEQVEAVVRRELGVKRDRDAFKAERDQLADERDAAHGRLKDTQDTLRATQIERDKLLSERDALKVERDNAALNTQRVVVDVTGADQVTSALKAADRQIQALAQEREKLTVELQTHRTRWARLICGYDVLTPDDGVVRLAHSGKVGEPVSFVAHDPARYLRMAREDKINIGTPPLSVTEWAGIQRSMEREGCPPDALKQRFGYMDSVPAKLTPEQARVLHQDWKRNYPDVANLFDELGRAIPAVPKKPRPDLIPAASLIEAGWCMAGGLERDDPNGQPWYETAPPAEARRKYHRSMLRHVLDWYAGNKVDADSKRSPLAHIICNAAILLSLELRGK